MVSDLNILFIGKNLRKKCNVQITEHILHELQINNQVLYWDELCQNGDHQNIDLILINDSSNFIQYQDAFKRFSKIPVIFISETEDISGYIAPFDNLFAVITTANAYMNMWGVPSELLVHLRIPVLKKGDYYRHDEYSPFYEVVYFPTKNTVKEADWKILLLADKKKISLNIISDEYSVLSSALNSNIKIIQPGKAMSVLKKAHLIIGSGQNVVNALALSKPCIVLGDYGLGGLVTPENYEQLKKHNFKGRSGGIFNEFIPIDLLGIEVKKALLLNEKKESEKLQEKVIADYNSKLFRCQLHQIIDSAIQLSRNLKTTTTIKNLKPRLSSVYRTIKDEERTFLMRGNTFIGEIDQDTEELLKLCNGTNTLEEIVLNNGYDKTDVSVFAYSVRELWKKKLIVFT